MTLRWGSMAGMQERHGNPQMPTCMQKFDKGAVRCGPRRRRRRQRLAR